MKPQAEGSAKATHKTGPDELYCYQTGRIIGAAPKGWVLLLGLVLVVAAAFALGLVPAEITDPLVAVTLVIFFLIMAAIVALASFRSHCRRVPKDEPLLIIGEAGLLDRRVHLEAVPWSAIVRVSAVPGVVYGAYAGGAGRWFLGLELTEAAARALNPQPSHRIWQMVETALSLPQILIKVEGLGQDVETIVKTAEAFRQAARGHRERAEND
jgi:hypothetical protein